MAEEKIKNPEEVEETLEEIRDEKRKDEKPKPLPLRILSYIFYPFVLIYRGICALIKKIHIPITAKITITFTLLFTFAVVLIDVFISDFGPGAIWRRWSWRTRRTSRGLLLPASRL